MGIPNHGCDDDRTDGFLFQSPRAAALRWLAAWLLATLAVLATPTGGGKTGADSGGRRFIVGGSYMVVFRRRLGRSADQKLAREKSQRR